MKHEDINGMSDAGLRARQLEAMRAFQSGTSWYDAYWYPESRSGKFLSRMNRM